MIRRSVLILLALSTCAVTASIGQTQRPITNADIVSMTKQAIDPTLIVKDIQSSGTDFDTSPQALIDLKNAGVDKSVMDAMLTVQASKPSAAIEAVRSTPTSAGGAAFDLTKPPCGENGCLLREGTQVELKFVNALSSKTAHIGDTVEFQLDDDLTVGDAIVAPKGAHALATVNDAKKSGMMGRPGELSVQIQYLLVGSNHVRIRGTQGREGDSKTGAAVALTVLFGPIGLIKHGKNIVIPAGTPLTAYVDQDVWLAPLHS
ncbi:MAG TPA: hypothetical protein VN885_04365 [Candidatus Acidoferrales bacterium]|nr:hypothetical protein [Candidatus Acidoferrales bacterium]